MQKQWNHGRRLDSVSPSSFARMAVKMDMDPIEALRSRYRFLRQRLIEAKKDYMRLQEIDPYFWWWVDAAVDVQRLVAFAKRYSVKPIGNKITDDMIEQAKEYPVTGLVEFVRGKALAFCHDDHSPSAYHGSRVNRLMCPVCDKSFSSIDILIHRDGMSFPDAVRFLQ